MAEFLVYTGSPSEHRQVGDIVCSKPDGSAWGAKECLDTFVVVSSPIEDPTSLHSVSTETVKLGPTEEEISIQRVTHLGSVDLSSIDFDTLSNSDWFVPELPTTCFSIKE